MADSELWLARVRMNARNAQVRRDLRGVEDLHRTVMSMFPDIESESPREEMGVLHRLDIVNERPVLLVQTNREPNLSALAEGYGDVAVVSLRTLFEKLEPGVAVRYRLLVNATKRPKTGEMAGKRVALGAADTVKWWGERAPSVGLTLAEEPTTVKDTLTGGSSQGAKVTLRPWRLDGVADVADVEKLEAGVRAGIGRGRAYGCGLLSLALLRVE